MCLNSSDNSEILNNAIDFILSTNRFDKQLLQIREAVSADHNQANNLTNLIICFFKQQIFFTFVERSSKIRGHKVLQ